MTVRGFVGLQLIAKSYKRFSRFSRLTPHSLLLAVLSLSPQLLGTPAVVNAQWGPDVPLTNSASNRNLSVSTARCVAIDTNGFVHVVWFDHRDGNDEIYYTRSTDWGVTWGPNVRLTYDSLPSQYPTIAVGESGLVHVAWEQTKGDSYRVYYKRSTDSGNTWGSDSLLSDIMTRSADPALAAEGNHVYAVWFEIYVRRVYFCRSLDGGYTWEAPYILGNALWMFPSIALGRTGNIHIIDYRFRYIRSSDFGNTWSRDTFPFGPVVHGYIEALTNSHLYVVWTDQRGGPWLTAIYFKKSSDGGINWAPDQGLTQSDSIIKGEPVVAGDTSGRIHVFYSMEPDDVMYVCSTDGGTTWGPNVALVPGTGLHPHASADCRGQIHLVWVDTRSGNQEIYYKRWQPFSGVEVSPSHESRVTSYKVFPNPFTSFTTLPGHETERFALYDISGKRVGTYRGEKVGSDVPPGVYFLRPTGQYSKPLRVVKVR